jgi:hypothetical protein
MPPEEHRHACASRHPVSRRGTLDSGFRRNDEWRTFNPCSDPLDHGGLPDSHSLETYQYFVQLSSVKKYAAFFAALAIAREFAIGLWSIPNAAAFGSPFLPS